ncbi:glutathione S-transferase N-terminal domain-containing protein [Limimaricola pyoseonensis]|uniref:Glutathione S-transferase n=1 Tax=Limimaricola pyoseonensis TaxID=521013 RepID=A0A1G7C7I4_9RHOB|nr:glutathione S-transferase N-terminal domain-containing protein [Limimaricola pyoseonensis]SDE35332.1 glutathione S-transferase [Limimaricola pyoseonensis]
MTYDLIIGDRLFSSWSLRGWLAFESFGLPVRLHEAGLYSGTLAADLVPFAPARQVPAMRTPDGIVVADSLAIAETLAERHPEIALWPRDPAARALARWLVAEMHAGFNALRGDCPMMLAHGWDGFAPSEAVLADLARIETLWATARERHGADGPWLFGEWSLADVFYAPVAARIATYGLPVGAAARDYVAAHLARPDLRRWRALGLTKRYDPMPYAQGLPQVAWPGPAPLPARAVEDGTPENAACPYSGKPTTHLAEIGGRVFGFCNAGCRDKTVADAEAWPAFMAVYQS